VKSLKNIFLFVIAAIDLLLVRLSFTLAIQLRGEDSVHGARWNEQLAQTEFIALFFISFFVVALFYSRGLYRARLIRSLPKQIETIIVVVLYSVAGLSILAFFDRSQWVIDSRLAVLYFAVICSLLLIFFRVAVLYPLYSALAKKNILARKAILIGEGPVINKILSKLGNGQYEDIVVVGIVIDQVTPSQQIKHELPVIGAYADIPSIVSAMHIDEAIITVSETSHEEMLRVIDICRSIPLTIVIASPVMELIYNKIEIESYFDIPVVVLPGLPLKRLTAFVKRFVDIILASIGFVIFAIPMVILGILVRVTSHGPVIYRQVRIGKDGKEFVMYKYRTMLHENHSSHDHNQLEAGGISPIQIGSQKSVASDLLTPIGRYLRKTSLDELPQLVNVLKGEMSLVGPRPAMVKEYVQYEQWHKRRLTVLPGCTGLWQVTSRGEGNFSQMVLLDLYYINNASLIFDLQLILKTIPVMIFGKGGK